VEHDLGSGQDPARSLIEIQLLPVATIFNFLGIYLIIFIALEETTNRLM
jgi:hypothetical protein